MCLSSVGSCEVVSMLLQRHKKKIITKRKQNGKVFSFLTLTLAHTVRLSLMPFMYCA